MSAAVPDDMMAIVIPMLYAVTTHCRPASPTLKSTWMAGNATFTINASRKIMKRPRLVAARVKRCVLVIGRSKASLKSPLCSCCSYHVASRIVNANHSPAGRARCAWRRSKRCASSARCRYLDAPTPHQRESAASGNLNTTMTPIASARMYSWSPTLTAAWRRLLEWVANRSGGALQVLELADPYPLEELWAREDLGYVF